MAKLFILVKLEHMIRLATHRKNINLKIWGNIIFRE